MADGTTYLKDIKKKLDAGQRQWKRGDKILDAFGYVRRRQEFVDQVNAELDRLGIVAVPPISTSLSLQGYTSFFLKDGPAPGDSDIPVPADPAEPLTELPPEVAAEVAAEEAAELATPPKVDATNPADLAVTVRNLECATREPMTVNPNDEIASAITKMQLNDYSQLVVATGKKSVQGVVSFKSIALQQLHGDVERVGDCIDTSVPQVTLAEPLLDVVARFEQHDCVLVFAEDKSLCGIVTAADIAREFRGMTAPFLIIGEIETHLRWLIDRAVNLSDVTFHAAPAPSLGRPLAAAADLTMGEIERILENPDYWTRVGLPYDRADFCRGLGQMRQYRNETMHFGDPLTQGQLEQLRTFARTLRDACAAMARRAKKKSST